MKIILPVIFLNIGAFALSGMTKAKSAVAYLVMLMLCLDVTYLGGLVDKLHLGTVVSFGLCFVMLAVYIAMLVRKGEIKKIGSDLAEYCDVHTGLNLVSSLAYTAILFIAQPKLYYWDEI
ncbi:MAG: hypothetical protein IKV52_05015, partial [Oscillospiraceae bacterium]|nr:hypothetical protein [Oscillospiraceae bacterium]